MKKILTVQDISCIGKCSLTVALPVISSMGVETRILPTSVLSTHTLFEGFTFRDLTSDIPGIVEHWKTQDIGFDAIYTGYLGSSGQIDMMIELFDTFKTPENLIIIDPVMGDAGKLYPGFDEEFARNMVRLISHGDIVMPNLTEASFLLGRPELYDNYTKESIEQALRELTDLGCNTALITGVCLNPDKIGVYYYQKDQDEFKFIENTRIKSHFHGTGDIFASTIVGGLMRNLTLEQSIKLAEFYVVEIIRTTLKDATHSWYGVNFEQCIPQLIEKLMSHKNLI